MFKKIFSKDFKIISFIVGTSISKPTLVLFIIGSIIMGFVEMLGILSVIPFISTVIDPNNIFENGYLYSLYKSFNFGSEFNFIIFLGIASFLTLMFSNIFITYMNWKVFQITRLQEHILSTKLLNKYLNNNYSFYLENNSSELEKNLLHEVTRVITDIFLPGIIALSKLSIIVFIVGVLLVADPILAISVFSVISFLYILTYYAVKENLTEISDKVADLLGEKFKIISEIFSGVREIKLDSYEEVFTNKYKGISSVYADQLARSLAIGTLPRYILEALAFGGIIIIVLILFVTLDDTSHIISLIALYALAGYRLLPAAQAIYFAVSKYKFGRPALLVVYNDLNNNSYVDDSYIPSDKLLKNNNFLELNDIAFSYKNSNEKSLFGINIDIKFSSLIGIIGPSGSGKSTLMDIVLGLLKPETGDLVYKGKIQDNFKSFKKSIGYVSQNVFISDDTIIRNIAFGIHDQEIDINKVHEAAKLANIHDHIISLPNKYDSFLGKGGSRLSGGQKQRIAIARVLYKEPKIIIFDEATSQLDVPTEKTILNSIKGLRDNITIILITHRVQILKDCDNIYVLREGKIDQAGKYSELIETNKLFQSFIDLKESNE